MEMDGFRKFVRRAFWAVFFYSAFSTIGYYFEGQVDASLFNPATNNLVIGLYIILLFGWIGGKSLRSFEWRGVQRKFSVTLFLVSAASMGLRTFVFPAEPLRHVFSFLTAALLLLAFIGHQNIFRLSWKYWIATAFGAVMWLLIEIFFSWSYIYFPIYLLVAYVLLAQGHSVELSFGQYIGDLTVNGHTTDWLPQIAGTQSILVYVLYFFWVYNWYFMQIRHRSRFFFLAFLGFLGVFFLIILRTFFLVGLLGVFDDSVVYQSAVNPLAHFFFLAYAMVWWAIVKPFVMPEHGHERGIPRLQQISGQLSRFNPGHPMH